MNGAHGRIRPAVLGTVPTDLVDRRAIADFNGDGKADILWRNTTTGETAIWFINGTTVTSTASVGTVPTTWSIVATGDFNGDGKADIVWRDTSGNVAIWLMNGATVSADRQLSATFPTNWIDRRNRRLRRRRQERPALARHHHRRRWRSGS